MTLQLTILWMLKIFFKLICTIERSMQTNIQPVPDATVLQFAQVDTAAVLTTRDMIITKRW